jgi:hypothetical protein
MVKVFKLLIFKCAWESSQEFKSFNNRKNLTLLLDYLIFNLMFFLYVLNKNRVLDLRLMAF